MTKTLNTNQNKLLSQMKPANSDKICRACLSPLTAVTGYYLFDAQQLAIKFASCCSNLAKLDENDNLPKMLCIKCKNKIFSFYSFQVMCLASDKYLRELNCVVATPTESLLELSGNTEKKYKNDITMVNISSPDKSQDVHEAPSISNTTKVKRSERLREKTRSIEINMQDHTMGYIANEHIKCETNSIEEDIRVLDDGYKIHCSLKTFLVCETNTPTKYEADEDENVSQSDPLYQEDSIDCIKIEPKESTEENVNTRLLGLEIPKYDDEHASTSKLINIKPKTSLLHEFENSDANVHDAPIVNIKKEAEIDIPYEPLFHETNQTVQVLKTITTPANCKNVRESENDPLNIETTHDTIDTSDTSDINTTDDKKIETQQDSDSASDIQLPFFKQCHLCSKRFVVEHRYQAHQREHQGLIAYPCTHVGCNKGFKKKQDLTLHFQKIHIEKKNLHLCTQTGCDDEVFSTKKQLSIHLRKIHNVVPEPEKHICETCGKHFSALSKLTLHRQTHDESEWRFVCKEPGCQKRFANYSNCKVHMMRHAGIKKYKCPYCGVYKTTSNELKIHINFHTREKTWSCRYCTKIFYTSSHRVLHERIVHQQARNYKCRYCENAFFRPMELKYHEMRHTGEKPFKCDECGKHFRKPGTLRTHRKIHERQKTKQVDDFVECEELEELND